jgi:putative aminopeptidase FrvX
MSLNANLQSLSNANGVAGRETKVRKLLTTLLTPIADEVQIDRLENVIAIKKGKPNKPKIMLAAHIDEVGLMVKTITKDGYLQFAKMGGIDDRILLAQKVNVLTEKAVLPGVVGSKPPHVQKEEERKKIVTYDDMFIDIGAKNRDDAKAMGVHIGDAIAFDVAFTPLGNDFVMGKAFDNRAGCAVMVEALRQLKDSECTVCAVGTVQEEIGARGAGVAAFGINPDVALVLDVTIAGDVPGVREFDTTVKLGKGPALTVSDGGLVTHPKVLRWMIDAVNENELAYQFEAGLPGGTDASRIHLTREGIPSGGISIPARYIHSPTGIVNVKDLENCAKLTALVVQKIQTQMQ